MPPSFTFPLGTGSPQWGVYSRGGGEPLCVVEAPPVMVLLPSRKGVKDFTKFLYRGPLSGQLWQLMLWVPPPPGEYCV